MMGGSPLLAGRGAAARPYYLNLGWNVAPLRAAMSTYTDQRR